MTLSRTRLIRVLNGRFSFQQEEKAEEITENELEYAEKSAKAIVKLLSENDISSLVLVRMSTRFPFKGVLSTSGDHPTEMKHMLNKDSKGYLKFIRQFRLRVPRQTLHFTLNSVVADVPLEGASWKDFPFAIIIPLKDVKERVCSLSQIDTFLVGKFTLPSSTVILVRKEDYDKYPKWFETNKGKAKIRIIEKNEIYPYVMPVVKELGYPVFEAGQYGWDDGTGLPDPLRLMEYCRKHGLISHDEEHAVKDAFKKGGFINAWAHFMSNLAKYHKMQSGSHPDHFTNRIEVDYQDALSLLFSSWNKEKPVQDMIPKLEKMMVRLSNKVGTVNSLLEGKSLEDKYRGPWKLVLEEEKKGMKKIQRTLRNLIILMGQVLQEAKKNRTIKWGNYVHNNITGNEFKNAEKSFSFNRSKLR